ncbi:Hsp70 family protein [Pseudanabaena sp. FACHB-1277]|uniref:Hsp70 family protein n=1 Tax=Pseudanabaena cinerea FACHB-1277 TaxID=2949581 RepID=A0A926Z7X9_9CYAN|nr:Hsp70 family protein [Pseudanabaena cinerea]MBD2150469.1 Hsp70 family protein [Pseudanabaena cinerea FACHB-1277]
MTYAVGIDLGTTNSVIAIYRRGSAETLRIDGRSTMPSVVSFRDDTNILVGQPAKSRLLLDPENTVASTKRFMGDRSKSYKLAGNSLSPVNIASLILKRLVESARKELGNAEIWDAVITVPAYFTEDQKEDTKRAGEEAGLNVLRLLPEPTAAAIAYGLDKEKDQTLMVYDLGGGTFDVSILSVTGNKFTVKAVGGNGNLGGDDFDNAIAEWTSKDFKAKTGIDLLSEKGKAAMSARQRLKEAAETAKIELSQSDRAVIAIPDCLGHPIELEITLAQYNKLIEPMLLSTVECMKSVLRDAKLSADDIDRVILVGGSTKNRAVREIVTREIKEPFTSERVDEVVAHGAAIMASSLYAPDSVDIDVSEKTSHSLGIIMQDDSTEIFQPVIPRQTTYPCELGVLGFTGVPHQEQVRLRVQRGENKNPDRNTNLGELMLPVSPPQNDYVPVGAVFALDADGIIHFTAVQFPLTSSVAPILSYAGDHDGSLDIGATKALIASGEAKERSTTIDSGVTKK